MNFHEPKSDFLARTTLGRVLAVEEKSDLAESADIFQRHFKADAVAAQALLAVGESPADPTIEAAKLAQWTLVTSQCMNLDEFLTK